MGGCLTDMEARSLSCMLALMPDDGLTRAHNWPHGMEIVIYAACAGAVGVIDQKSHYYIRSMHHHRTAAAVRH